MYILFGWPDPFTKAKPGRAHNPAPYIHSASCRCLWTTYIPQGQSAYKSHLPLLNALERVPVTEALTWVKREYLAKRTIITAGLSSPPFTWACLWPTVQCSISSSFLPWASQMLILMSVQFECTMAAASTLTSWQSPDTPQQVQGHPA